MKNKALTWTIAIGILAIAGYATYAYIKKKKEEAAAAKPKINIADAKAVGAGLGSFISGLFTKDTAPATTTSGLEYPLD